MLQKDNRYRVLREFFDNPSPKGGFQLRSLSRRVGVAPPSVKKYLSYLEREGLIVKEKLHGFPVYYANRDNEYFRFLKKIDTITRIKESGLLEHISDSCMPDAIVLFGSSSLGEDIASSDIDLFVLSKEEKINRDRFEKILNRKISLFFCNNFGKLSAELKNNILNGVILKGYIKAF